MSCLSAVIANSRNTMFSQPSRVKTAVSAPAQSRAHGRVVWIERGGVDAGLRAATADHDVAFVAEGHVFVEVPW